MSRLHAHSLSPIALVLSLPLWTALEGTSAPVAARVDRQVILIADIDVMSIDDVRRIHIRLLEVAHQAVQDVIDQRLGIESGPDPGRARKRAEFYRARRVNFTLPPPEALETELAPERMVARIGNEPIRAAALEEAAALRLYRLRGELYLQRRRQLDTLIEQHLLRLEAQSRGMSLKELEVALSRPEPVSDSELAAFVSRKRAAGQPVEDPKRVRPYLEFQKSHQRRSSVVQARRTRTRVDIYLRAPKRPLLPMETAGGVALGPTNGQVLVAYTNYECAICRATHVEIDRLLADTPAPRIILRDFAHDAVAMEAAALVRCASRNGRGSAIREILLHRDPPAAGHSWFNTEQLQSVAPTAGMSPSALRACTSSPEIRAEIEQDTRSVHRLGFDDAPAFIAAGVPLSGMQTAELLRAALQQHSAVELSVPR
jgi:protein-disulfide isomerase